MAAAAASGVASPFFLSAAGLVGLLVLGVAGILYARAPSGGATSASLQDETDALAEEFTITSG